VGAMLAAPPAHTPLNDNAPDHNADCRDDRVGRDNVR
jgi:hypothetical protein